MVGVPRRTGDDEIARRHRKDELERTGRPAVSLTSTANGTETDGHGLVERVSDINVHAVRLRADYRSEHPRTGGLADHLRNLRREDRSGWSFVGPLQREEQGQRQGQGDDNA
jgi:hypothetical protein